jgi:SPP1 gp7 family putative phage head morphogenesis protein
MSGIITYRALKQRDPSRTTALRNSFAKELKKRFTRLCLVIWRGVVDDAILERRFAYNNPSDKVNSFMKWLETQVTNEVLDQTDPNARHSWFHQYIKDAYQRGVLRARAQMRNGKFTPPPLVDTFSDPRHLERLTLLYARAYNELKGITDETVKIASRELLDALASGANSREIAKRIDRAILGKPTILTNAKGPSPESKADLLARTEIIRAHAEAQLQEFKNWGVEGVTVMAEFITAGDARVCSRCNSYNRDVHTLEEARGIIPIHPRCRCIWVPFVKNGK